MLEKIAAPIKIKKSETTPCGFQETLLDIAERVREHEERRGRVAGVLKLLKGKADLALPWEVAEQSLVKPVKPDGLGDLEVVGVDGGVLSQQLHGLDLILTRAVAVIFRYAKGKLGDVRYYPSAFPEPRLKGIVEPLDARELEQAVGMERQLAELRVAVEVLKACDPELLLLDGSVAPQYVERTFSNRRAGELYHSLLQAFVELYQACEDSGVLLVGAVKDSRSARGVELLGRMLSRAGEISIEDMEVLKCSYDTTLLDHLLGVSERSFVFPYTTNPDALGLGELASSLHVFYLKAVPFDRPLRVEFVGEVGEADRVASLVYALSSHHEAFGLPPVLIEADARARLHEEDLGVVRDYILDRLRLGQCMELRRHRWPFG